MVVVRKKKPVAKELSRQERSYTASYLKSARATRWPIDSTSLNHINQSFNLFNIIKYQKKIRPNSKLVIADLGCGDSRAIQELNSYLKDHKIGSELWATSLKRSKEWKDKDIRWKLAHATNLSNLPESHFDILYSHYGIGYSINFIDAIKEAIPLLKSNGKLIVKYFTPDSYYTIKAKLSKLCNGKLLDYKITTDNFQDMVIVVTKYY